MTPFTVAVFLMAICVLFSFIAVVTALSNNRTARSLRLYFVVTLLWMVFEFAAAQVSQWDVRLAIHKLSGSFGMISGVVFTYFAYTLRYKYPDTIYWVILTGIFSSAIIYLATPWGIADVGDEYHIGEVTFGPAFTAIMLLVVFNWAFNSWLMHRALRDLPEYETGRKRSIQWIRLGTIVLAWVGILGFFYWNYHGEAAFFFRYIPLLALVFLPFFVVAVYKYDFLSTEIGQMARDLFNDAKDGIIISDRKGIVRQVNPMAQKVLQMADEDMEGLPLWKLFQLDDADHDLSHMKEFELVSGSLPGLGRHLWVSITPVVSHTGAHQYLSVLHDVTDEKAAEEMLNKSREELELEIRQRTDELVELQEAEAIGVMAGSIAHDFNNLLAAVLGFATAAHQDIPDGAPIKKDIEEILQSAKKARQVVDQLLMFSRKQQSRRATLEVGDLLRSTLPLVESSLSSNIKLQHSIMDSKVFVMASQTDLSQALMNLCTNATQSMRGGGVLGIHVVTDVVFDESVSYFGAPLGAQNVKICVSDNGEGIQSEIRSLAFEPFFTTRENAIGFGLPTGLRIVSEHSGGISVEDNPEGGAVVSICLPRLLADDLQASESEKGGFTGAEHILVVDDDERLVKMIQRLLGGVGYRISSFSDPQEALTAFRRTPGAFDLVITDFMMPSMSGIELTRFLVDERSDLSVLLVSGNITDDELEEAKQEGIRGYLRKPFVREELLGKVRRILDDRQRVSFPTGLP